MAQLIDLQKSLPAAPNGFQNGAWQKGAQTGPDAATGLPIYPASVNTPATGGVSVKTANYTLLAADCGLVIVVNSASAVEMTLPAAVPFAQWNCFIASIGAGAVTISPGALDLDGSISALVLAQGQSCYIATDGVNYFSGRGGAGGGGATPLVLGFIVGIGTAGNNVGPMLAAPRAGSFSKCIVVVKAADTGAPLTFRIMQNGTDIFGTDPTIAAATASGTVLSFTSLPTSVTALDVFSLDITGGSAAWNFTAMLM